MAGRVIALQVGGEELLVETSPVGGWSEPAARVDRAGEAVADAFDRAQSAIVAVATETVSTIGQLARRSASPQQVQVKFGLKVSAQGSFIVAGASAEATLEVTLTYPGDQKASG